MKFVLAYRCPEPRPAERRIEATHYAGLLTQGERIIDRVGVEGSAALGRPVVLALLATGYDVRDVQANRTAERRRRRQQAKTDIDDAQPSPGSPARMAVGSETRTASASVSRRTRCSTREVCQSRITDSCSQAGSEFTPTPAPQGREPGAPHLFPMFCGTCRGRPFDVAGHRGRLSRDIVDRFCHRASRPPPGDQGSAPELTDRIRDDGPQSDAIVTRLSRADAHC
jgi:hypothetical protein